MRSAIGHYNWSYSNEGSAVGYKNRVYSSATYSNVIGNGNKAGTSGGAAGAYANANAIGSYNTASNSGASGDQGMNTASARGSTAIGYKNIASFYGKRSVVPATRPTAFFPRLWDTATQPEWELLDVRALRSATRTPRTPSTRAR